MSHFKHTRSSTQVLNYIKHIQSIKQWCGYYGKMSAILTRLIYRYLKRLQTNRELKTAFSRDVSINSLTVRVGHSGIR